MRRPRLLLAAPLAAALATACGGSPHGGADPGPDASGQAGGDGAVTPDGTTALCQDVTDTTPLQLGTATADDEVALTLTAHAASATSWGTAGNEALILEVSGAHGLIGHLILHQGAQPFDYTMQLGALAAGEPVSVRVSSLSAASATKRATICGIQLTPIATLGAAAEGIAHAPILRWPVQKRFNDVPLVLGWSKARQAYQSFMTNEDGGTAEQCGGGASGMQAEIARWGRSTDIESHYSYGGTPTWERCTGRVPVTTTAIRMEAAHPILYYGDGHNRVFEDRSGYGQTCGTGSPEKPDGDLAGWNTQNPGNSLADDDGRVVILRPLPFAMDPLGYATFGGRREGLPDHDAAWLYRIASLELVREHKIDDAKTFPMPRYLYVDVRVADVGGSGDSYCSLTVSGGFKLRAITTDGTSISSPQITAAYASNGSHDWKRVAIALPANVTAASIDHFVFDAYDGDGIYVTGLGDAFIAEPAGDNGATLDYVRKGTTPLAFYVDDNSDGCTGGVNTQGPGGTPYSCTGGSVTLAK